MEKQNIKFLPSSLITCVIKGDTATASLLLKAGIPVDGTDGKGNSALALASNKGMGSMVTFLMNHGASYNVKNTKGLTPLVDAASLGSKDVVLAILPFVKKDDPQLLTIGEALQMASRQGFLEVVKVLVEAGAPMNSKSDEGWTPLTWAAKGGHDTVIEYLISQKVDVNVGDKDGYTALDWAKNEGYPKVVDMLKKAGGKGKTK
jgi:ankyrin repeat protein